MKNDSIYNRLVSPRKDTCKQSILMYLLSLAFTLIAKMGQEFKCASIMVCSDPTVIMIFRAFYHRQFIVAVQPLHSIHRKFLYSMV